MGFGDVKKSSVKKGLAQWGKAVGQDLKESLKAASELAGDALRGDKKELAKDAKQAGKELGDAFVDGGAASVGVAETLGLRYPVTTYQQALSPQLTRGSRLDDAAIADLSHRGFKGVVNLCLENDDDAPRARQLGMNSLHLELLDNAAPSRAAMVQFLQFVTAPQNQPAYVHCEAGKGRTGVASACYRMAVQGWTPEAALAEAKQMGLSLPGQVQFIEEFGRDLKAGRIAGFPVH